MLDILLERIRQKHRTYPYPQKDPVMPPLFKGLPVLQEYTGATRQQWEDSMAQCPSGALFCDSEGIALDMGKCTFCGACAQKEPGVFLHCEDSRVSSTSKLLDTHESGMSGEASGSSQPPVKSPAKPQGKPPVKTPASLQATRNTAFKVDGGKYGDALINNGGLVGFSRCWQLASTDRQALIIRPGRSISPPPVVVEPALQKLFTKSFRFRQVSAGGCNACEADLNVLTTLAFDISRFGMDFVASPRHADAMAITGPVTRNMQGALIKVDNAMPKPRISMAVGACAISGGLFHSPENKQQANGVEPHMDVDLYIPGCPPHPYTILDGFLRFLGRI